MLLHFISPFQCICWELSTPLYLCVWFTLRSDDILFVEPWQPIGWLEHIGLQTVMHIENTSSYWKLCKLNKKIALQSMADHPQTWYTDMHFCSCDLDLHQMTLIYALDLDPPKMCLYTKNELSRSTLLKGRAVQGQTGRQTHRQMRPNSLPRCIGKWEKCVWNGLDTSDHHCVTHWSVMILDVGDSVQLPVVITTFRALESNSETGRSRSLVRKRGTTDYNQSAPLIV